MKYPKEAPLFEFIGECRTCQGWVTEGYLDGGRLWIKSSKCGGDWPADDTTAKPITPARAMLAIAKSGR